MTRKRPNQRLSFDFEPREVRIGVRGDEYYEVTEGLKVGVADREKVKLSRIIVAC